MPLKKLKLNIVIADTKMISEENSHQNSSIKMPIRKKYHIQNNNADICILQ